MAVRVLLAEDHALVRAGLRSLLKELGGVEVVGEAGDGHEALRLVAELRPDVVLLDISMPGLSGLEVAARVVREHPDTKVLVLSMHRNEEYVLEPARSEIVRPYGIPVPTVNHYTARSAIRQKIHAGFAEIQQSLLTMVVDRGTREIVLDETDDGA